MRRRGALLVVLVAALGGGLAWWVTAAPVSRQPVAPPGSAAAPVSAPTTTSTSTASRSSSPAPVPEVDTSPAATSGGSTTPSWRERDDPGFRARIEVHAKIARPTWGLLIPRLDDGNLRAEAEAMAERLSRLDEPAEGLARDEYALTQRLIARGSWGSSELRWIQELNSGAAMVIQGE